MIGNILHSIPIRVNVSVHAVTFRVAMTEISLVVTDMAMVVWIKRLKILSSRCIYSNPCIMEGMGRDKVRTVKKGLDK